MKSIFALIFFTFALTASAQFECKVERLNTTGSSYNLLFNGEAVFHSINRDELCKVLEEWITEGRCLESSKGCPRGTGTKGQGTNPGYGTGTKGMGTGKRPRYYGP